MNGKIDAAAHAQPQENGGQKGHQSVRGPHCGQRAFPNEAAHHPGIGQVVQLLQEVAQDQGKGKAQQAPGDASLGEVTFGKHSDGSSFPIRVFFQCIMHGENLQMEGEDRGEERFNQPQTKI